MESGWVVNFKSGISVLMDEETHKFLKISMEEVSTEEHWFSLQDAIKKYSGITLIKGC